MIAVCRVLSLDIKPDSIRASTLPVSRRPMIFEPRPETKAAAPPVRDTPDMTFTPVVRVTLVPFGSDPMTVGSWIVAPLFAPASYALWIASAAACWFAAFALLAWRYIPMLLKARVDGKPH